MSIMSTLLACILSSFPLLSFSFLSCLSFPSLPLSSSDLSIHSENTAPTHIIVPCPPPVVIHTPITKMDQFHILWNACDAMSHCLHVVWSHLMQLCKLPIVIHFFFFACHLFFFYCRICFKQLSSQLRWSILWPIFKIGQSFLARHHPNNDKVK